MHVILAKYYIPYTNFKWIFPGNENTNIYRLYRNFKIELNHTLKKIDY